MNGPYETITLDHTARHRRRMVMTADGGLSFLLDLEQAQALRHGDGLVLEDGRIININSRETPIVGNELSILQDIFKGILRSKPGI